MSRVLLKKKSENYVRRSVFSNAFVMSCNEMLPEESRVDSEFLENLEDNLSMRDFYIEITTINPKNSGIVKDLQYKYTLKKGKEDIFKIEVSTKELVDYFNFMKDMNLKFVRPEGQFHVSNPNGNTHFRDLYKMILKNNCGLNVSEQCNVVLIKKDENLYFSTRTISPYGHQEYKDLEVTEETFKVNENSLKGENKKLYQTFKKYAKANLFATLANDVLPNFYSYDYSSGNVISLKTSEMYSQYILSFIVSKINGYSSGISNSEINNSEISKYDFIKNNVESIVTLKEVLKNRDKRTYTKILQVASNKFAKMHENYDKELSEGLVPVGVNSLLQETSNYLNDKFNDESQKNPITREVSQEIIGEYLTNKKPKDWGPNNYYVLGDAFYSRIFNKIATEHLKNNLSFISSNYIEDLNSTIDSDFSLLLDKDEFDLGRISPKQISIEDIEKQDKIDALGTLAIEVKDICEAFLTKGKVNKSLINKSNPYSSRIAIYYLSKICRTAFLDELFANNKLNLIMLENKLIDSGLITKELVDKIEESSKIKTSIDAHLLNKYNIKEDKLKLANKIFFMKDMFYSGKDVESILSTISKMKQSQIETFFILESLSSKIEGLYCMVNFRLAQNLSRKTVSELIILINHAVTENKKYAGLHVQWASEMSEIEEYKKIFNNLSKISSDELLELIEEYSTNSGKLRRAEGVN